VLEERRRLGTTSNPILTLRTHFSHARCRQAPQQAQKMQRQMESLQAQLETKEIDVTAGGGAVALKISTSGKLLALKARS